MTKQWTPSYERWRHGGWYVTNVRYPTGSVGCVSSNYPDGKWRIVCDRRDGDATYPTRDEAARAELEVVQGKDAELAPWLQGMDDAQLRYSAATLFEDIDASPEADLDVQVAGVCRLRSVDAQALRDVGERYRLRDRGASAQRLAS